MILIIFGYVIIDKILKFFMHIITSFRDIYKKLLKLIFFINSFLLEINCIYMYVII